MAPYDHGATATYSCDEWYFLNGDAMRTCGDGVGTMGTWDGMAPSCDREFLVCQLVGSELQLYKYKTLKNCSFSQILQ